MPQVFADTSYWIALNSPNDDLHIRAIEETVRWGGNVILTSEAVLVEFLDGCATRGEQTRKMAAAFVLGIRALDEVKIVTLSSELFQTSLALYESRPDKKWSMTDCSSIMLCQQEKVSDVLTYDIHFVQAGFNALLR